MALLLLLLLLLLMLRQAIFISLFLWVFSYFVLILFNWHALFTCSGVAAASVRNASSCADLSVIAADQSAGLLYTAFVYTFLLVLATMLAKQVRAPAALKLDLAYLFRSFWSLRRPSSS